VSLTLLLACGGASGEDAEPVASAATGSGGAAATSGSGGNAGVAPGVVAASSAGTGGANGSSSGGAGNSPGSGGMAGASAIPEGLGESCPFGCSESVCGQTDDECETGYCLWDARYLSEGYCTVVCDGPGAACPGGYECLEDGIDEGVYYCGKPKPVPPADLGRACDETFLAGDCHTTIQTRRCAKSTTQCERNRCVRNPGASAGYCSMECGTRLPCPEGYECLTNPGVGGGSLCYAMYAEQDVFGLPCVGVSVACDEALMLCVSGDEYGLCSMCLNDYRAGQQTRQYCSVGCSDGECPDGYACMPAGGEPAGSYCATAP